MPHSPGFLKLVERAQAQVTEISVPEAARLHQTKRAVLIDVREESEWEAGHASGAIHLSKGLIERDIEQRVTDLQTPILCYCGGGYRSILVAQNLQNMGYTSVKSVAGGWKAWVGANLPTTSGATLFPRSPYEKLGGLYYLPRLIDKVRWQAAGKLTDITNLNTGFDRWLLEFLCLELRTFEKGVLSAKDDFGVLVWLKHELGPGWPGDNAIAEFNEKQARRKPDEAEKLSWFDTARAALPPTRHRVETFFDLIELEEGRFRDR